MEYENLTKMNKKQLYDECRASREIIKKYQELESQCESVKEDLEARSFHIQKLQIQNDEVKARNSYLEGELMEYINNSIPANTVFDVCVPVETQTYNDILNIYKEKINKFDKLKEENSKIRLILKSFYDEMQEHVEFISDSGPH